MTDLAIHARQLTKRFGSLLAMAGLDLAVPRGSCFGLIGPNGAGKTTFIKVLLGICAPDGGQVEVLGGAPEDPRLRARIGYLPERLALPPAFKPTTFLESVARLKGLGRRTAREIPRVLTAVGLAEEAWSRRIGTFSKGMRQRTGLAAALLGQPELLVLDEPTDGIDPLGQAQIRGVMLAEVRRGTTVFLNSHLLSETEKICDRIAILANGRVVREGSLAALKRTDRFRVVFAAGAGGAAEIAPRHGFVPHEIGETRATFTWSGADPGALSAAVRGALEDGLVLLEVSPELTELEGLLAEAVERARGPAP